jgi:hypothetical protein
MKQQNSAMYFYLFYENIQILCVQENCTGKRKKAVRNKRTKKGKESQMKLSSQLEKEAYFFLVALNFNHFNFVLKTALHL